MARDYELDLDPEFQRGHVWDDEKRSKYVEFGIRGGKSSRDLQFNCVEFGGFGGTHAKVNPRWMPLVDGKQRLTAVQMFFENKIPVFGHLLSEYTDARSTFCLTGPSFKIHINDLSTMPEILQWYLDLNDGGVVHTSEELNRVRDMLKKAT